MIRVEAGDCREVIRTLADSSIHSCVTDPPYSLTSIRNRFGKARLGDETRTSQRSRDRTDPYARGATGFMGQKRDTGEVAHDPAFWAEVYRVLRPGGYLLAFAGTRTYHRMACAIEDAGFEIRDQIGWCYASGFPKSHDVSKAIDRAAAAKRGVVDTTPDRRDDGTVYGLGHTGGRISSEPITAAAAWQGYSTALKPAWEPVCVARKPLDGTVAQNVLRWGTGALNIDGCRVAVDENEVLGVPQSNPANRNGIVGQALGPGAKSNVERNQQQQRESVERTKELGRWPANLVHDDSDEVRACFPDSAGQQADVRGTEPSSPAYSGWSSDERRPFARREKETDTSAARFFFAAKADASDRWYSRHPTVKPVELMRWLVRLVTPPGGTCLDPFAGSGTTGVAAQVEGRSAILIEREESYLADIHERLAASRGMATKPTPTRRRARVPGGLLEGIDE